VSPLELSPVHGLLLGVLLSQMKLVWRLRVGPLLAVVLAVVAAAASGELRESWAFVLVDLALVVGSAAVTLLALCGWNRIRRGQDVPGPSARGDAQRVRRMMRG
jgi:hypothetical protein